MSFISGSTKSLGEKNPKLMGQDQTNTSSHQAARPLPYFAGQGPFPLTWICKDPFNVRLDRIRQKVGKKKADVGFVYTCGFVGLGVLGPLDFITQIELDGEVVWEGSVERGVEDSVEIVIENRGTATCYWGTETQTADSAFENGTGQEQPGFRGQFYVVFYITLAENSTSIPNARIFGARYPDPSWMSADANIKGDANLGAVFGEFLDNKRFGLGYAVTRIDYDSLDLFALTLAAEDMGFSPYIDREKSIRQTLVEGCEYVDGYPIVGKTGVLGFNLVRPDYDSGSEVIPTIDEDDIIGEPQDRSIGWRQTKNRILVSFRDSVKRYVDDEVSYHDAGNYQIVGEEFIERLNRPWVTKRSVAYKVAYARGRIAALPRKRGIAKIRKSVADQVELGGLFFLGWDATEIVALKCRIIKWRQASTKQPEIEIEYEEDFSHLNDSSIYDAPSSDQIDSQDYFDPQPNEFEQVIEVPAGFRQDYVDYCMYFAARGSLIASGFNIWTRRGTSSYKERAAFEKFALHIVLDVEVPIETHLIEDTDTIQFTVDSLDDEFTVADYQEGLSNEVLIFLNDEIFSIYDPVLVSGTTWTASFIRNRFDTVREVHAAGSVGWLMDIDDVLLHNGKGNYNNYPIINFKFQPFSFNREVDLSEVFEHFHTWNYRGRRPWRPLNLQHNGTRENPTYSTGEDLVLTWDITFEYRIYFWDMWDGGINTTLPYTTLEFWTVGGVLKRSFGFSQGVAAYTYPNATLVSDFSGEESVVVRAIHVRNSLVSLNYTEITVNLV